MLYAAHKSTVKHCSEYVVNTCMHACMLKLSNENTAGADASVEMPIKATYIKLLIAFIHAFINLLHAN